MLQFLIYIRILKYGCTMFQFCTRQAFGWYVFCAYFTPH